VTPLAAAALLLLGAALAAAALLLVRTRPRAPSAIEERLEGLSIRLDELRQALARLNPDAPPQPRPVTQEAAQRRLRALLHRRRRHAALLGQ
jgi:hypothetical protein